VTPAIEEDEIDAARDRLESLRASLGSDDDETQEAMSELGTLLISGRKYAEARDLMSDLLDLREARFGHLVDEQSIAAAYWLGYALAGLGDLPRARKVQEQVLKVSVFLFGLEDANTLRCLRNLDLTLVAQGNADEISTVGSPIIEALLASTEAPSKDTLDALYTLAAIYRCNFYPQIASKLYKRAIRGCLVNRSRLDLLAKSMIFESLFVSVGLLVIKSKTSAELSEIRNRHAKSSTHP
jgi:hypothetical protein